MLTIILAGGGPRTAPWFLLLIPLIVILGIIKGVELLMQHIKKRKLARGNQTVNDLVVPFEHTNGNMNNND